MELYDVAIIGAGPAGLTAAIYAKRRKLKTVIFEASQIGGQMILASIIENYPGLPSISGVELAEKMKKQVEDLSIEVKMEEVISVKKAEDVFEIRTTRTIYQSKALIIATGMHRRKLGVKGEEEFLGRGVSYCTICDGPLFKEKVVAVIGGGNSAVESALFLSKHAKKVYLIHRRKELRAEPYLQDKILAEDKIETLLGKVLKEIKGKEFVEELIIEDVESGELNNLKVDGVFIEIGGIPTSTLAKDLGIEIDNNGFIKVDKSQKTNVEGVFAAGDVTDFTLKQIATAIGQGAMAAESAYRYLKEKLG